MVEAGEELVGTYLTWIKKCDFIKYNTAIKSTQGEVDVIGIDLTNKTVYLCEVSTHLVSGLQYTKKVGNKVQTDNVERIVKKFTKDNEYANNSFSGYNHIFMLWSPIIKKSKQDSKNNQMRDIKEIKKLLKNQGIIIKVIMNEEYLYCVEKLIQIAKKETRNTSTSIMRFLQIWGKTNDHVKKVKYNFTKNDSMVSDHSNTKLSFTGKNIVTNDSNKFTDIANESLKTNQEIKTIHNLLSKIPNVNYIGEAMGTGYHFYRRTDNAMFAVIKYNKRDAAWIEFRINPKTFHTKDKRIEIKKDTRRRDFQAQGDVEGQIRIISDWHKLISDCLNYSYNTSKYV